MLVLAGQALLILYPEEAGLALVGVDRMGIPMLAGMEPLPLTWDMAIRTMAWAMAIHIGTHELHSARDKAKIARIGGEWERR